MLHDDVHPDPGPGGKRQILGVVTRSPGAAPVTITPVATYTAAKLTLPSKPAKLHVLRSNTTVTIRWSASNGVKRYGVTARSSLGPSHSWFVGAGCRAVRLTGIPTKAAIIAGIVGIRFDGLNGKAAPRHCPAARDVAVPRASH